MRMREKMMTNRFSLSTLLAALSVCALLARHAHGADDTVNMAAPRSPPSCVLVNQATIIATPSTEPDFGQANVGHQIGAGAHMVLAIRAFEDLTTPDAQTFWKLTLELPRPLRPPEKGHMLTVPVLRSFYTAGGLTWLKDGSYAWGQGPVKNIDVVGTDVGIEFRLKGRLWATYAFNGLPSPTDVDWRCVALRRTVAQLDPWEGRPGTTIKSFHPAKLARPLDRGNY